MNSINSVTQPTPSFTLAEVEAIVRRSLTVQAIKELTRDPYREGGITARQIAEALQDVVMNELSNEEEAKAVTVDAGKLNQEYALWLGAGISPDLLTKPDGPTVALTVRGEAVTTVTPEMSAWLDAQTRRRWSHCLMFVRDIVTGSAWEVDDSSSSDERYVIDVSRPSADGSRQSLHCPDCSENDGFTADTHYNGTTDVNCNACGYTVGQIERGIPAEFQVVR